MFTRKIYNNLLDWKKKSQGKTALLIEGARRVGKSTTVEEFARNEYESYILIDFAFAPEVVKSLFKDLTDLDFFFLQLQLYYHVNLSERNSIIIFDEVQFFPLARQAIKRLVADGRYDYIETGSLISIKKNTKSILIPSEEKKITMHPMDFEEFLWALGDQTTIPLLESTFSNKRALGDAQNRNMMNKFRLYMLIGGMPQAVETYIEKNNFEPVDDIKRDILQLYHDDFYRIDPSGKISALFDAIPSELSKHSSRYQVSSILPDQRVSTISEQLSELIASKTVLAAYHANDPNVGLALNRDVEKFKLFLSDTGLMVTLMFQDKAFTDNMIYKKLLADKLSVNLGVLFENIVAQSLAARGHKLFYYTFYNEINKKNYEIDFLITGNNKICPIEVKSSGYRVHTSLDKFSEKYAGRIANKLVIGTKDFQIENDITYLPVYYTQFL
ncbi:MAG: ATP-binding protein [Fibrobacter sp.]|nr:ATP-binding protein [Fibrobacter sp.]